MKCCICHKEIKGFGNNPEGAVWKTHDGKIEMPEFKAEDRCCDECNQKYVITARINPQAIMTLRNLFGIQCSNQ